ncbi:unnamed protein product [Polarella glacialis]|uniref:Calcineurin-like phosphoesterase domain-containing protein n=1 Tax=Polarella glacialis TaxID=89957 RepID=A0A813FTB4_POLGL|nr:unnamed protein product [Polarella glacialis]
MPHRLKFIICGNHEKEEQLRKGLRRAEAGRVKSEAPVYLERRKNARRADGLRIWGWPFTWQDQAPEEVPEGLDILVTHVPPKGILDHSLRDGSRAGSSRLTAALAKLKKPPRLHLFGHIHEGHGTFRSEPLAAAADAKGLSIEELGGEKAGDKARQTLYVNAAIANDGVASEAAKPCIVIDLPLVAREPAREVSA